MSSTAPCTALPCDPLGHEHALDLGDGHWLDWLVAGDGSEERIGAVIYNTTDKTRTGMCSGYISWAPTHWERAHPEAYPGRQPRWTLAGAADEHLTVSPSVLCRDCGDHGWIRGGKWQRA